MLKRLKQNRANPERSRSSCYRLNWNQRLQGWHWRFCVLVLITFSLVLLSSSWQTGNAQLSSIFFPSNPALRYQTSGPSRLPDVGDWYTTATSASSDRLHRIFIDITQQDLAAAGGSVVIGVRDGQSNGLIDEVDGLDLSTPLASRTCPTVTTCDPTRFTLRTANNQILQSQTFPSGTAPGNVFTFAAVTTPGTYQVTSETGALPIFGDATPALNDDDNSFEIFVTASVTSPPLIGQTQGTFQRSSTNFADPPLPSELFFFVVGPDVSSLFLRNFDLDAPGSGASLEYIAPDNPVPIPGTASGDAVWNGAGGSLNTGGDTIPIANSIASAGVWLINLLNFNVTNQTLFEANTGDGRRLVLFDSTPTRLGNFTIQHNAPPVQVGSDVCYDIVVNNLFFTSDIINLRIPNPPAGYTFSLRAGDRVTPLTDTDQDGNLDTGILPAFTGTRTLALCVTPADGAPRQTAIQIEAVSFMDARLRQQLGEPPPAPVILQKQLRLDEAAIDRTPNFKLVKRITSVLRNGSPLSGVNFAQVIDDPNSGDDNAPGWSQISLEGQIALTTSNPVQSRDQVTYRVYFLSDGTAPALAVSLCDLIPGGTTYVPNTLVVRLGNEAPRPIGEVLSPLAPLPTENSCPIQENPNGAIVVKLGDVSNLAGQNFGFIQFQVQIN